MFLGHIGLQNKSSHLFLWGQELFLSLTRETLRKRIVHRKAWVWTSQEKVSLKCVSSPIDEITLFKEFLRKLFLPFPTFLGK